MDAINRCDQDICAPMCWVIDEMVDMTDQFHPRPITAVTEGGENDEIEFLGNRIPVKLFWDEVTHLTALRDGFIISQIRYYRGY